MGRVQMLSLQHHTQRGTQMGGPWLLTVWIVRFRVATHLRVGSPMARKLWQYFFRVIRQFPLGCLSVQIIRSPGQKSPMESAPHSLLGATAACPIEAS